MVLSVIDTLVTSALREECFKRAKSILEKVKRLVKERKSTLFLQNKSNRELHSSYSRILDEEIQKILREGERLFNTHSKGLLK
jgi:DNA replication protein DnaC